MNAYISFLDKKVYICVYMCVCTLGCIVELKIAHDHAKDEWRYYSAGLRSICRDFLLTRIRSSSRQPGERLPGEYRNFSSRVGIPLLCAVLCGGLSGKNMFSLLSVFNSRRSFVCSSPPVPLGGPEIVRLWGTGTKRGLFGGSAGGSVCWGLRIPSTVK